MTANELLYVQKMSGDPGAGRFLRRAQFWLVLAVVATGVGALAGLRSQVNTLILVVALAS